MINWLQKQGGYTSNGKKQIKKNKEKKNNLKIIKYSNRSNMARKIRIRKTQSRN